MGNKLILDSWWIPVLVVLGLLVLIWYMGPYVGMIFANGPIDYIVTAEFEELPKSDSEMEKWLLDQSGVYIVVVNRDGNRVQWIWGHVGTTINDPVTPDLRSNFTKFGYTGLKSYKELKGFRDK